MRWQKLNVVQKRWLCVSACTSFNFFEAWFFVRSMSARSFNRVTDNVWRLCEVGVLEARSFNLAQMYVKSTNVEVGAEAPISQNRCYLLPFFSFRHSLLFLMLVSKLKILRFLLIMRKVKLQILSC